MKPRKIHQNLVDRIYAMLEKKSYAQELFRNAVYTKGECDILYKNKEGNWRYIEVKCNHTEKGYEKAVDQIERFTEFFAQHYTKGKCRGVYHTPQTGYRRIK